MKIMRATRKMLVGAQKKTVMAVRRRRKVMRAMLRQAFYL